MKKRSSQKRSKKSKKSNRLKKNVKAHGARRTQTVRKSGLLGRFLLQGFTQKPKKSSRSSSSKNPSSGLKLGLFSRSKDQRSLKRDSVRRTRLVSLSFVRPLIEETNQAVSQVVPDAVAIIHPPAVVAPQTTALEPVISRPQQSTRFYEEDEAPRWLLTGEILRPDDTLKQSIEGFLLDQRSAHTQRAYGKDLKRFIQYLLARQQERGIEKIDRLLIIAYKDSLLNEGLEHTTVDRHLATLRSFFRWLVDDGKLERSPVEGVRFINPKRLSSTLGFSDEEVTRVLGVPVRHSKTGALHHAILSVLFYCGLRRSELCALRTTNLGTERNHPVLRLRGKGNAERLIVIPPKAWESLNHYLTISRKNILEDQVLFNPIRNNRGGGIIEKNLDPSTIYYIVTKYAKLAGIANRVSPHSCRATAISNARDHQVSDRSIQEFAGWASPDMITRYDKRRNAIENSASLAIRYESPSSNGDKAEKAEK